MKKKLFSVKIYLEGLRQTRVAGLFLLIATVLVSALGPLASFATSLLYESYDFVDLSDFTPWLILFMFVGPIVLTMRLFSFLNKRNGSDFYHALPCTRTCMLTSFSLSVITWLAGTILLTILSNAYLYTVCPNTYIHWSFIPYSFCTYFAGSLLVFAVMLVAKSITGTGFSNIVVGALIGFGPRIFTSAFVSVLTEMVPIVDMSGMGFFLDTAYNIPVNIVMEFFGLTFDSTVFGYVPGIIATFVLAVLYFLLAALLLKYRKSETAQKAAPNKVLQHIIRCLITIPITLVIPVTILQIGWIDFFSFMVIGFVAVLIYFGYELLSTKKVKNLLYALPVFGAVILFDILFGVALVGASEAALMVPDVSDVKSVHVSIENADYNHNHYNVLLTENHFVADERLIQTVTASLDDTVQFVKSDQYYEMLYNEYGTSTYSLYKVAIRQKNGTVIKRDVLFTASAVNEITAAYENDLAYKEKLVQLPDKKSINSIRFSSGVNEKKAEEIWAVYSEEYSLLGYEDKRELNGGLDRYYESNNWSDRSMRIVSFYVSGYKGVNAYEVEYLLTPKTPKAYQLYLEVVNQNSQEQLNMFWEELENIKEGKSDVAYDLYCSEYYSQHNDENDFYFYGFIDKQGVDMYDIYMPYSFTQAENIFSILKDATARPVDLNQPVFAMEITQSQWEPGTDAGGQFTVYFSLSEAEMIEMTEYFS